MPARCAWRARTTSCRTATWWSSASTSDLARLRYLRNTDLLSGGVWSHVVADEDRVATPCARRSDLGAGSGRDLTVVEDACLVAAGGGQHRAVGVEGEPMCVRHRQGDRGPAG